MPRGRSTHGRCWLQRIELVVGVRETPLPVSADVG